MAMLPCRACVALLAAAVVALLPAGASATVTSFNVSVGPSAVGPSAAGPSAGADLTFGITEGWSVLLRLEHLYYDEEMTCTPKQAFKVRPEGL